MEWAFPFSSLSCQNFMIYNLNTASQITGTRWHITDGDPFSCLPRMRRDARENAERVLHEIIADSNATLPQICARTGMALRTINNAIATLRAAGIIVDSINGAITEPINGTKNGTIKEQVLLFIRDHVGCKGADLAQGTGLSPRTLARAISDMADVIEYRGSKKTGGYYLKQYGN